MKQVSWCLVLAVLGKKTEGFTVQWIYWRKGRGTVEILKVTAPCECGQKGIKKMGVFSLRSQWSVTMFFTFGKLKLGNRESLSMLCITSCYLQGSARCLWEKSMSERWGSKKSFFCFHFTHLVYVKNTTNKALLWKHMKNRANFPLLASPIHKECAENLDMMQIKMVMSLPALNSRKWSTLSSSAIPATFAFALA